MQYQDQLPASFVAPLTQLAAKEQSFVSITAAETLCKFDHLDWISQIIDGLSSDNPYILLMSARAFELVEHKPASAMAAGKKEWLRLKEETEGKWKGYDLYAYWSLSQVFGIG